jgi:LuxR family transcriptional regulator, maltose regulon positive regulatory protein
VVRARPWLCLALAAQAGMAGRLDELERLLGDAERAHASGAAATPEPPAGRTLSLADDLPTMIAMWRVNVARVYGDAQPATRFAEQALAGMAGDDPIAHAMVDWALAQPDWMSGRLAAAEAALARAVAGFRAAGVPEQAAAICYELVQVQRARGRLGAALATGREALEIITAVHPAPPPVGAAHVLMAEVLRERNELDAALDHATRGVALCRQLPYAWALAAGLATLAWIRQAQGDPAGARETMGEAERVLPDPRLVELWSPALVSAARLALAQGRIADAARRVRDRGLGVDDQLSYPSADEPLAHRQVDDEHRDRAYRDGDPETRQDALGEGAHARRSLLGHVRSTSRTASSSMEGCVGLRLMAMLLPASGSAAARTRWGTPCGPPAPPAAGRRGRRTAACRRRG